MDKLKGGRIGWTLKIWTFTIFEAPNFTHESQNHICMACLKTD